jgi:hypothetical protein
VPTASTSQSWLIGRRAGRARLSPTHSIVTRIVRGGRRRRSSMLSRKVRTTLPVTAICQIGPVRGRDVGVHQQVMASGERELLRTDELVRLSNTRWPAHRFEQRLHAATVHPSACGDQHPV